MADVPSTNLVEQKITGQVTVTAGTTGSVSIPIPDDKEVWLKGYGYTWFTSNTFKLRTGNVVFPSRTDQEGSIAQPVQYGRPFKCRAGGDLSLSITNGDSSDHTYDVVFYILTSELLDQPSTGGELVITTAAGSSSTSQVSIYDSSGVNAAPVTTTFGLGVDPKPPTAIQAGTLTTAGATAVALGSSAALKRGVLLKADLANGAENVLVGNSGGQYVPLEAGDSIFIDVADVATVYVKRSGGTNVTVNFVGS